MRRPLSRKHIIAPVGKQRIDSIRAAYAAFNRGDWDSFVRQGYHEDAVWEAAWDDISFATMRGRESSLRPGRHSDPNRSGRRGLHGRSSTSRSSSVIASWWRRSAARVERDLASR